MQREPCPGAPSRIETPPEAFGIKLSEWPSAYSTSSRESVARKRPIIFAASFASETVPCLAFRKANLVFCAAAPGDAISRTSAPSAKEGEIVEPSSETSFLPATASNKRVVGATGGVGSFCAFFGAAAAATFVSTLVIFAEATLLSAVFLSVALLLPALLSAVLSSAPLFSAVVGSVVLSTEACVDSVAAFS